MRTIESSIGQNRSRLCINTVVQTLDDYPIPVWIRPKSRAIGDQQVSELQRPFDRLNSKVKEPVTQFPPGCQNEAQVKQRVCFAMEQEIMNKLKKKRYYFCKAYFERRRELGLSDEPDPVSKKLFDDLKKRIKSSKMKAKYEPFPHHPKCKLPELMIYCSKHDHEDDLYYEDDFLKKGIHKYEIPEQRSSSKRILNPIEFVMKIGAVTLSDVLDEHNIDIMLRGSLKNKSSEIVVGLGDILNKFKKKRKTP